MEQSEFASTHQKRKSLRFETPNGFWLVPRNVKKLGEMISEFPNAEFVGGCTSVPIQNIPKKLRTMDIIDLSALEEMRVVEVSDGWLKLGGGLTLTEVDSSLEKFIPKLPGKKRMLSFFLLEWSFIRLCFIGSRTPANNIKMSKDLH